jgi:LacI family transcriptional regulator
MRKVVVLIESSRAHGRGLLRGVARYNRECGPWSIYFEPQGLDDPPPPWLKHWSGDGILVRICDRRMAQAVLRTGKPVVDLRGVLPDLGIPVIGIDNEAVGVLGAEHLLERGLRHFGFFGRPHGTLPHLDARGDAFLQRVEAAGHPVHVFEARGGRRVRSWEQEQERLTAWVVGLPKPVGVMACNDDQGLRLLDACRRADVLVPDQVAVVGVDNDEIQCHIATPPLTSIDLNPERVGYEAAALLERLMDGRPPPAAPVRLSPRGVVRRQSTDIVAVEDPEIAAALQYVRRHACDGLRVAELLERLPLSHSVLERRFRALIGRSPKAEITRLQLERAKQLLAETDLPLDAVAAKAGFRDARYLCDVFARKLRLTPGTYRKQSRQGP